MIKVDKNKIFKNGIELFKIENDIIEFLEINEHLIFLIEDNFERNDNVLCYNFSGDKKWTIEDREYFNRTCPVIGIYYNDNIFQVYRRCGVEEEIDIYTGKILSSELVK